MTVDSRFRHSASLALCIPLVWVMRRLLPLVAGFVLTAPDQAENVDTTKHHDSWSL
jgi:hypothetical protein